VRYDNQYKTVVIDVDGVLVHWSPTAPANIKAVVDRARESLIKLRRMGLTIHLYTARPVEQKEELSKALKDLGFVFDHLTCGKPAGFIYLDDRAVRFRNWEDAMKWINVLRREPFSHDTYPTAT